MAYTRKVDVHSHYLPPDYQVALRAAGIMNPDGMPFIPEWSLEAHLKLKDELNISKSYLSISTPGTHLVVGKDAEARDLTRKINEYGASIKRQHPTRFGLMASLPLPDVEGSLAEIDHALDECDADGFVLETSSHGIYLGDKRFDRVFAKLNERKAIVSLHPTTPHVCRCATDQTPQSTADIDFASPLTWPRPMMEFFFDTTRACTNLILSGTISRNPNIKFIIPHMGGSFPTVVDRVRGFVRIFKDMPVPTPDEIEKIVNEVPFDRQYKLLMEYARPDRICYGTDASWTPAPAVVDMAKHIEEGVPRVFGHLGKDVIAGVFSGNAEKLFARAS